MAAFLLLEAGVKNISDSSGSRCVSVAGSRCEVLKAEAIAASAAVTAAAAAAQQHSRSRNSRLILVLVLFCGVQGPG